MALTTIKEVENEIEKLTGDLTVSQEEIQNLTQAKTNAFNSARALATYVNEDAGNCQWDNWAGGSNDSNHGQFNLSAYFGGAFGHCPARTHDVKKRKSKEDCGWKADKMWDTIDAVATFKTKLSLENQKRVLINNQLTEMQNVHTGLVETAEEVIELGSTQTDYEKNLENLNIRKALVARKRVEVGLPIAQIVGVGVVVVIALILIFKKN